MKISVLIIFFLLFFHNIFAINIDSLITNTTKDSTGIGNLCDNAFNLLTTDRESVKKIIDYTQMLSEDLDDDIGRIRIGIIKGLYYFYEEKFDTAIFVFNQIEILAEENNYTDFLRSINNNRGVVYGYLGYYNLKAQEFIKMINSIEESGDLTILSTPYVNLGVTFYFLSDITKAEKYFLKAKKYTSNPKTKRTIYNNLAAIEEIRENFDSALVLIDSAIANYRSNAPIETKIISRIMRVRYLFETNKKQEAIDELKILENDEIALKLYTGDLYSVKAHIAFASKDYKLALSMVDSTFANYPKIRREAPYIEQRMLRIRIESYYALKDLDKTIKEQRKLELIKDAISEKRNKTHTEELEYQAKIKKKELSILKLKDDNAILLLKNKNKSLFLYLNIVLSVLLILIVGILLYMRKSIQRKNQIALFKKEQVEEKIKNINNGIISKSLIISNIAENLEKLISEIRKIKKDANSETEHIYKNLLSKLSKTKNNLKKTIDSDEELSIANEVFYRELLKINNTLSPSDLKMCAQLKLNLNTKEISQMNYQSIRTTEGARYRIRKKLGLSSTDNLNTFLMSIKC